jgi:hypothetical protein
MISDRLLSILRSRPAVDPGRGPACPDEHLIAAYVDGTLVGDGRDGIEAHLADCGHCLALIGLLSRERTGDATEPASELAITRAHALVQPVVRRQRSPVPQWAAAAVLVVALASLVRLSQPVAPTAITTDGPEVPTTRAAAAETQGLKVLSPQPNATVSANELAVRWTPVPGSRYYDVRVVSDAGDVVTEVHVAGTSWRPQDPASLQPGVDYFVHVDAFVADDKSVSSDHVPFRVVD